MNCCPKCFNDDFLTQQINDQSKNIGDCDYCKTKQTIIIDPSLLSDYFQPLIDLYQVSENGNILVDLLKKDWVLFTTIDKENAKILLEDMLETKFDGVFIPKKNINTSNILNWQDFKNELKHENRYFSTKAPSYDRLKDLLQYLIVSTIDISEHLYRARINEDKKPIEISLMGKPSAHRSTAGRANPVGIPYLYTASNIKTTIAEIRPQKGDFVTVATFYIKESLKLADLRNPRQSISPFELDEESLNRIFLDLDYLCHLGEELSRPILPREAHLEFLSSQYLCELIKNCGFDGVIYRSSVGDGDNFVIFDDKKLEAIETECYRVQNVGFEFNKQGN